MSRASQPFHVMSKPTGAICNIGCKYCFYLEKEHLYPNNKNFRMSDEVLEAYIKDYIAAQPTREVTFAWQGGEPTLLGVDFFRKVVALQKEHAGGHTVANCLQTNATLLNDEWCQFFHENQFLLGISIDGPEHIHDTYRVNKKGGATWAKVMHGIELCRKHRVEFNTLTCVHKANVSHPHEVYNFLKKIGSTYLQFIPIVERKPTDSARALGLDLAEPPDPHTPPDQQDPAMTEWSVPPRAYGKFLCDIFDKWARNDIGKTFVQIIDVTLGKYVKAPGGLCVFNETCGNALAIEHNGDLYACDHYVYPKYHVGNILNQSLGDIVDSHQMRQFGKDKRDTLPRQCRECDVRFACNGECPKHRFAYTTDGEPGLNYLCPAYLKFFRHTAPVMKLMANYLQRGQTADAVMKDIRKNPALLKT